MSAVAILLVKGAAGGVLVVADKVAHAAHESAIGMLAGSAGMVAYATSAVWLLGRYHARQSALAAMVGWILVAALAAIPVLAA